MLLTNNMDLQADDPPSHRKIQMHQNKYPCLEVIARLITMFSMPAMNQSLGMPSKSWPILRGPFVKSGCDFYRLIDRAVPLGKT